MRMMLKTTIPVEYGNRAISDGTIAKILEGVMTDLKPESSYFFAEGGERAALLVFDMTDASDIPPAVEPLFNELNAKVDLIPCMNVEDLEAGLQKYGR